MADYRILVTGSRDWDRPERIAYELGLWIGRSGAPLNNVVIIHGDCAHGADRIADRLAREHGYRTERHPADWERHGKSAGFIRNAEMVNAGASLCLAFIKDGSRGATHCADLAEKANIPVRRFTA